MEIPGGSCLKQQCPPWGRGYGYFLELHIKWLQTHNQNNLQIILAAITNYKQLLDEVFVITGIIKVEVSVICRSLRLRLITLTE